MKMCLRWIGLGFLLLLFNMNLFSEDTGKSLWSFAYFEGEDYFYMPSDMATDLKQSLIYIADSGNHRVVAFDFNGKFIRSIGKQGQGPGEFSKPTGLDVFGDSQLAVADYNNHRIQIFNRLGELIRTIHTREINVADLVVFDEKFFTIPTFGMSGFGLNMGSKADFQPLVVVLDNNGNKVRDMSVSDFPDSHPFIRAINHRVSLALSPDEKLYLPYFARNVIQVFDLEGKSITKFNRALSFIPITPGLKKQVNREDGVISMVASLDIVNKAAQFGAEGLLYVLTNTSSYSEAMKRAKDVEDMLPQPMRIDVIDPNSNQVVRYLACDPNVQAFVVLDKDRVAYLYEDIESELILKCVQY